MKTKLLIAIFALFILFACQNDDDEPSVETIDNLITGEWQPLQNVKVYEDNSKIVNPFPHCSTTTNSHLYFSDDINQLFYYNFIEQETSEECFFTAGQGNWEQLNETDYQVSLEYYPESDYQSNETETFLYQVDFISSDTIQIHHKTLLMQLQAEEPNLVDFYRIYEKQRIPFE
ncbi:hypothetical protein ACFQ3R_01875 [Mesonia ostreae]|uniref:Lipocalin-like domain-containing protein n=1 Tax=Mesonia ostreae TaxID=861110 RepID=A0ABU2KLK5_9FLAO|nr:hypothetical protein [Mesonia ostreae]MDT0295605.1 hypothetical protein [Mesonia ostreae]